MVAHGRCRECYAIPVSYTHLALYEKAAYSIHLLSAIIILYLVYLHSDTAVLRLTFLGNRQDRV